MTNSLLTLLIVYQHITYTQGIMLLEEHSANSTITRDVMIRTTKRPKRLLFYAGSNEDSITF